MQAWNASNLVSIKAGVDAQIGRVRDAGGAIIEYVVDAAGRIISSRIVEGGRQ